MSWFNASRQPRHFILIGTSGQPVGIDYRQRISVATWSVVMVVVVSLILRLPTVVLEFSALGSPISFMVSKTTLMAVFSAVLAGAGAESVVRCHPRYAQPGVAHREQRTWAYWALPAAVAILSVLVLPLGPTRLFQAVGVLISGALIALSFFGLYATVDRRGTGFRRARIVLNVLAYASALALFLLVYQTRTRSLLSGSLIAITATLLAVELLRSTTNHVNLVLRHAAVVGLVLGEVTWALNYWLLPGVTGGLLLLLIFYLLVGLAQQGLQERLNRRVVLEFGFFAVLALILIAVVGPGF